MNFYSSFLVRVSGCLVLTLLCQSASWSEPETSRAEISTIATTAATTAVRNDEFATIPNGDALYGFWAQVQRASWFSRGARNAQNSAKPKTTAMTRYELALQTGRAYFALSARARADANWRLPPGQAASVRALRELLSGLRSELRQLQVDVDAATTLCDQLLKSSLETVQKPSADVPALSIVPATSNSRIVATPSLGAVSTSGATALLETASVRVPLSQRLRVSAALSSLEREASDPFGDRVRVNSLANGLMTNSRSFSRSTGDAAYEVADWLRLRAGFENVQNTQRGARSLLQNAGDGSALNLAVAGIGRERAIGGGVDIEFWRGLRLSGDVARVASTNWLDNSRTAATRIAGGVGISAWQNRLALSMNLSRLVPEDSAVLSSSAAGLNLAVGGERVKLNLLFQQLFGPEARTRGDRVIAGGININF